MICCLSVTIAITIISYDIATNNEFNVDPSYVGLGECFLQTEPAFTHGNENGYQSINFRDHATDTTAMINLRCELNKENGIENYANQSIVVSMTCTINNPLFFQNDCATVIPFGECWYGNDCDHNQTQTYFANHPLCLGFVTI